MNADKIMERLAEYGADTKAIRERFMNNMELYCSCLQDFFEDNSFLALGRAIDEGRYQDAFEAAHALKGTAGNMGFDSLYATVCSMVDNLRAKEYQNLDIQYKIIASEYELVQKLVEKE